MTGDGAKQGPTWGRSRQVNMSLSAVGPAPDTVTVSFRAFNAAGRYEGGGGGVEC